MSVPTIYTTGDAALLQYATDSAFINFGVIETISGNEIVSDEVETTKLADTSRQFQAGIINAGEIKGTFRFNGSQSGALAALQLAKTQLNFRIVPTDITDTAANATTNSFETYVGFIKAFKPLGELTINKEVITEVTLKLSGAGTFNTGA